MRTRVLLVSTLVLALIASFAGSSSGAAGPDRSNGRGRGGLRVESGLPKGFVPAAARPGHRPLNRWFVVMKSPSVAEALKSARGSGRVLSAAGQRSAFAAARRSQNGAIQQVQALGGRILFRYGRLVNAFSVRLASAGAQVIARRADVASVQPASIVALKSNESTAFIGAPKVWKAGYRGEGVRVALVDTGIDYTHADFGGPGTPEAYETNDPTIIEPGTFPTAKVIGGYDFVGENYDVLDDDPTNDTPVPDPDPLDSDGHGTHTGGTCCGFGVDPQIQSGVAPEALLYAIKVWDEGNSTDDVLVAGYEWAVDPDQDGSTDDHADVLSFSGGVSYGTQNSVEALSAQEAVNIGTVFVASAGNEGNQPSGGSAYILGTPAAAPGVIAVAASLDSFLATTMDVNSPPGVELPDDGVTVIQPWGAGLSSDLTTDLFDAREVDVPADPENPAPSDALVCEALPAGSLAGQFALIFKGSTGSGDCDGSLKALNAQDAGATGVLFWNGFGGLPFALAPGCCGDDVTIPVIMASTSDSEVLGATMSPNASDGQFNDVTVNATFHSDVEPVPGFEDSMADFTSEGPARVTSVLKPDISAPGVDIVSAGVGTGDGPATLSGTSMAAPHVSGTAALIKQIHPDWNPAQVKAALMNYATLKMKNNDLSTPVPATVMGAGRVRADQSAKAESLAIPASLSFGLQALPASRTSTRKFTVTNVDDVAHHYKLTPSVRYWDFDPSIETVTVSPVSFDLKPGEARLVTVHGTTDPSVIQEFEQEYGWYYFHPNVDGVISIVQTGGGPTRNSHVSWHIAPLAASLNRLDKEELDVSGGPGELTMLGTGAAGIPRGIPHGDLYLLGGVGDTQTFGEEDIAAIGARSFTGSTIDGVPEGVPTGTDEFAGIDWQTFLWFSDYPDEPVEFGIQFNGLHNTTETLEVDVLVDAGADGIFADPGLQADYLIAKLPERPGTVCVYDLSLPNPFDACTATYFPDYSNYNANVLGIVVDANVIGLSDDVPELSYKVEACTGKFSGDVPFAICDEVGAIGSDGTYLARLNTTNPALSISHLVCQGFWDGPSCGDEDPIVVSAGSAGAGESHPILALFPNNNPEQVHVEIVRVTT
jgi:subtilisin family serine protease